MAKQSQETMDTSTTEASKVESSAAEHVAPPPKPLTEEVKAWLVQHEGIYELLPNGKLQCQFTKHEIPGRIELLEKHLQTRKYLLARKRAAVAIPDEYKEIVVKNEKKKKGNMLFCIVTKRSFLSTPEELSLHLSGRRFKNAYRKYLAQKELEAKQAAELEDADDILKNEDMFLDMVKSDDSDSEGEGESEGSGDSDDANGDDDDDVKSDNEVDGMDVDDASIAPVEKKAGKKATKARASASKATIKVQQASVQDVDSGKSRKRKAMSRGNKRKAQKSAST